MTLRSVQAPQHNPLAHAAQARMIINAADETSKPKSKGKKAIKQMAIVLPRVKGKKTAKQKIGDSPALREREENNQSKNWR